MEKFTTSVRKKYQRNLINKERQWPPCHTKKLIRLVLLEKDHGYSRSKDAKRIPLEYEDLFKVNNKGNTGRVTKILVEGSAGIGKTTLCTTIAEDWANGKLFQQFKLLLLLPLRETPVSSASSITELLGPLHSSENSRRCVANALEENEGEDVLIVADGWDELAIFKRQEGTFLYNLLSGKMLPFASVLLTSRHTACASLHRDPYFDYFVEICGFSNDNIKEYILSEFDNDQSNAVRLLEQLENNPVVESICSVPLNCAIICHLWRTLEAEDLPTTMTNLYTKLILNVVLRNIQKFPAYKSVSSLPNIDALPADLQQSWWLLCNFAHQTLARDQLVFTREELVDFFPQGLSLDEKILCFGMLQSSESILDVGYGVTFHFPHRTFQEFLAALYNVKLPVDAHVEGHITLENSPIFWRFFFGLSFHNSILIQTNDKKIDLLLEAKQILDSLSILVYQNNHRQYLSHLFHFAFEANNSYINNKVVNSIIVSKKRSVLRSDSYMSLDIPTTDFRTAYDCAALIHLFANINKHGTLEISMIEFNEHGIHDKQVIALANALADKNGKLQVGILSLSKNKLSWGSLRYLFNRASTAFQSLQELYLSNIYAADRKVDPTSLADALSFLYCPNLRYLELSENELGIAEAKAVGRLISNLTQHVRNFELYLNDTKLGDDGLKGFTQVLKGECHLQCLELRNNNIRANGITYLTKVICSGKLILGEAEFEHPLFGLLEMCGLDLSGNPLGIEGTLAVGRMLNSTGYLLCSLFLTDCKLTTSLNLHSSVGLKLRQMIPSFTISMLRLDNNSFTGECSYIIANFMVLCPWLRVLQTRDCNITSDDLKHILAQLSDMQYVSQLSVWDLRNNRIDDSGVFTLLKYLPSMFPEAESITMWVEWQHFADDSCAISDEMRKKLQEELAKLKEVREAEIKEFKDFLAKLVSTNHELQSDKGESKKLSPAAESSERPPDIQLQLPPCSTAAQEIVKKSTADAPLHSRTAGATPTCTCRNTTLAKTSQYNHYSSLLDVEIRDLNQYNVLCPLEQAHDNLDSTCTQKRADADHCSTKFGDWNLNKVLDSENKGVPKHLGQIADFMDKWEGSVADHLGLTKADVAAIKTKYPRELKLQSREALEMWKQKVGSDATYGKLILLFECADHKDYADYVRKLCYEKRDTG